MKKAYATIIAFSALGAIQTLQAATLTVHNLTGFDIKVCPRWTGRKTVYIKIFPGKSHKFSSGLHQITYVTWREFGKEDDGRVPFKMYRMCAKDKICPFNSNFLSKLNFGAKLEIRGGGSVYYNFGVEGINKAAVNQLGDDGWEIIDK